MEDCSPDVLKILPELFGISRFVLLKLSPMADITMAVERLDRTYEEYLEKASGKGGTGSGCVRFTWWPAAENARSC